MRLSLGQDLRMVQKQVLAPRMIQSMEILQLSILALQERIEQELNNNPVLEIEESTTEEPAEGAEESTGENQAALRLEDDRTDVQSAQCAPGFTPVAIVALEEYQSVFGRNPELA